jgi:hypothetical protein
MILRSQPQHRHSASRIHQTDPATGKPLNAEKAQAFGFILSAFRRGSALHAFKSGSIVVNRVFAGYMKIINHDNEIIRIYGTSGPNISNCSFRPFARKKYIRLPARPDISHIYTPE